MDMVLYISCKKAREDKYDNSKIKVDFSVSYTS